MSSPGYQGALAKFPGKIDPDDFDSLAYSLRRYKEMPRRLGFAASDRKAAEIWQKKLRAKLFELVGSLPKQKAPLNPQVLETREFPHYTRETIIFTSMPGMDVLGYLLIPKNRSKPMPAVVSVPGHGRGADDIAGIDASGNDRTAKEPYEFDYAVQLVEHGMAAFALEPMGFGCRRDAASRAKGLSTSSCQPSAGAALLFGETMIGWRVYDVIRTVDYLSTRTEFDASRIGLMGISGGGMVTMFGAAMDPRITASFVSGYTNSFRDSILSLSHCIDNYVPGILQWCEQWDIAGLIAPRPLFCEGGVKDPIFPLSAFQQSTGEIRKIYGIFSAESVFGSEVHEGAHVFHGKQGLPFLARHLKA